MGLLLFVYDLHPTQVWDLVEKHDTGCTPGGGKESMSVFHDAGLLFVSNKGSETPYRLGKALIPFPLPTGMILDIIITLKYHLVMFWRDHSVCSFIYFFSSK